MAQERIRFLLPPGRIVQGSPTFKQDKDRNGKLKEKPNWFLAVAVPKTDPGIGAILNEIFRIATTGYQQYPAIAQRAALGFKGGFSWKIEDGDDPTDPKNIGREGYAGCYIFKLSTSLGAPLCCDRNNAQIDPALIKTGYYVDVGISVVINEQTDTQAGIYINPDCVRLLAYGQEIHTGPSPEQIMGQAPTALPAGASMTPLAPSGGMPATGGFGGIQPQFAAQQPQFVGQTAQQPQFAGQPAGFPGASAPAAAAGGMMGNPVPAADQPGFPATASPSNPYPGATAYPGFLNPQR